MRLERIGRRAFVARAALSATTTSGLLALLPPNTPEGNVSAILRSMPLRVFKVRSPKEDYENWVFSLVLEAEERERISPVLLETSLMRSGVVVKRSTLEASALGALHDLEGSIPARTTRQAQNTAFWNAFFRMRFSEPRALGIDSVAIELTYESSPGNRYTARHLVHIHSAAQQSKMVFPFVGRGLVTQGGVNAWGHRNRSGQFAIDAVGLTEQYAPMVGPWGRNEALAGWGRPIIAPAAGVVVIARGDRPDQPRPGNSDPAYYLSEHPQGGDPGNHVVIDHGHGEFSMIAHLQAKSLAVSVGQRVVQGQPLGALGNSGDSTSPHLHHQLQNGPEWEFSDAIPCRYEGLSEALSPGMYFDARS